MLIFLFIITLIHLFCLTCTFMMLFIYVYRKNRDEWTNFLFSSLFRLLADGQRYIVSFVLWINTKTFSIRHWRSTRAHADIETRERERKRMYSWSVLIDARHFSFTWRPSSNSIVVFLLRRTFPWWSSLLQEEKKPIYE
jgi:hypothetical protein